MPSKVEVRIGAVGQAALPLQVQEPILEVTFGQATCCPCLHKPVLIDGYPAGFVQRVAAERAGQHRDVGQVAAFLICADRALLDVRRDEKLAKLAGLNVCA